MPSHAPPQGRTPSGQDLRQALVQARAACVGLISASARHATLARLLDAAGERIEARAILHDAARMGGGDASDHEALAFAAFGLNEHDLARDAYARVASLAPGDALARYNLASAERNLGRLDEAEARCNDALDRDPDLFQAALLRSQLKTQKADANHVGWLRDRLVRNPQTLSARIFLNYALGKELEDIGDYDQAFAHFRAGAQARRGALDYDVSRDLTVLERIEAEYAVERSDKVEPARTPGPYGFVLGLPRSGTTLIERVLTGHPGVRSNGETDNFSTALLQNAAEGPGDIIARAARAEPQAVADRYRKLAGPANGGVVLEKLPLNYLYAGAIARALPDAPIILVRRHPIDNCLAMYTTLFGAAYPFSYDLAELARYYAGYARLMDHWKGRLGARLLEVPYEGFVNAPQDWGPRLAAHLDIAWQPGALAVEKNPTASTTASAVQVRQPIYKSAVGRWTRYQAHLGDLVDRLGADA